MLAGGDRKITLFNFEKWLELNMLNITMLRCKIQLALLKLAKLIFILSITTALASCHFINVTPNPKKISCAVTSKYTKVPIKLSQSCIYKDLEQLNVSSQLIKFTPNYQLWSDGATKTRWIYLPQNTQINTSNPDRWIFPVGTQIFKEFRQISTKTNNEIKVETRHLQKIKSGAGINSWLLNTYLWNIEQTEAYLNSGVNNVLNTEHDIPTQQDCIDCHKGNTDIILGFEAIQLSDKQGKYAFGHGTQRKENEWTLKSLISKNRLTHPIDTPVLPGVEIEQKVLGYLHANCGNCHNKLGHAAEQEAEHLNFRHELSFDTLAKTNVYTTAVNQKTRNFTAVPYIILGASQDELALYQSALYLRMNSTDEDYRMPMLASEKVDYQALSLIHQWLKTLPTPDNVKFNKTQIKPNKLTYNNLLPLKSNILTGPGLQVEVQFINSQFIPPVMAIYWPEDHSLKNVPIMDHNNGYFSEKLILGNKGSQMSLRNSDEVGHTIYVKDKKQNVRWQLNYMPPNSSFEQELFWDNDIFVEMKCRLHLYMSSWVGSISSKFYKITKFKANQNYQRFSMTGFPEKFKEIKIWLPKFGLFTTTLEIGQQKSIELKLAGHIQGKITLKRSAQ